MKRWSKNMLVNLSAILLGAMLTFAFAPYEIFPLAVLAPAGLLFLWLNTTPKRAFFLGFLFGLGFFGTGVYWVYISIHFFGGVPPLFATLITSALIAELSFFPAIVGYLTRRYFSTHNTGNLIYAFPAIWVFSEWIRSWLFTGFAWLFIGYTQTHSPLKGYAPIFSVYGVTLAVLLTSGLVVNAIIKLREHHYRSTYLSLFIAAAIWMVGSLLNLIPWTKPIGNPITVSLVQGNIPQQIKWSPEHLQLSFDRYEELTTPLWGKSQLIIWPEAAIPTTLNYADSFIKKMRKKAKASDSHLILGIPVNASTNNTYYNAVISVGKDQNIYFKRHLVPFGEYVPFSKLLSGLLNVMNIPTSDLVSGKLDQAPFVINNIKILVSICYEITFPELINDSDETIGMLLTITNDAWFGKSTAQAQHLQMAEMRAIELRRPVLIVSNDGITAIIGPDGHIISSAPPYETFVLTGKVQPTTGLTPMMLIGIDPILLTLLLLLMVAILGSRQNQHASLITGNEIAAVKPENQNKQ